MQVGTGGEKHIDMSEITGVEDGSESRVVD